MSRETTIDVIETQTPSTYRPTAPTQDDAPEAWPLIIRPQRHLFDPRLGKLWQARDLMQIFVWREVVAGYK